jgi:hypothetical protein
VEIVGERGHGGLGYAAVRGHAADQQMAHLQLGEDLAQPGAVEGVVARFRHVETTLGVERVHVAGLRGTREREALVVGQHVDGPRRLVALVLGPDQHHRPVGLSRRHDELVGPLDQLILHLVELGGLEVGVLQVHEQQRDSGVPARAAAHLFHHVSSGVTGVVRLWRVRRQAASMRSATSSGTSRPST